MEKGQLIFFICFASLLLILLFSFLLFIFIWQRGRSNKFIQEREAMKSLFNEQLLRSQLEIQEQSFNSISMEIHDNVGQNLSLLKVQLNIMDQQESYDKNLLKNAITNAGKIMHDLRVIALGLNTDAIQQMPIAEAIKNELERVRQTRIIRVDLEVDGTEKPISESKKLILFRIVQESLQNIIKHSNAQSIRISLQFDQDGLDLEIKDDGIGFDSELYLASKMKGLGLKNIIKRAEIIGGFAKINSQPNVGTTVRITVKYV